ncbi:PREDICTED: exosome component 10 [Polistes dominula]|uniref:phospholipase A1 n=1 Tax=Polistes dominula TaxID=743375 RepID=A0ABM1I3Y9_POLDO|nr:PREDICTED: exosome component 10 [Polistes dominula]
MEPKENQKVDNKTLVSESEQEIKGNIENEEIIPGFSLFDDYLNEAFSVIKNGIRASNGLPIEENYNYYECFPSFNKSNNDSAGRLLKMMQKIINLSGIGGNIGKGDIGEQFDLLLEANDVYLDKAGLCMDEESGIVKNPEIELVVSQTRKDTIAGSWNMSSTIKKLPSDASKTQVVRLLTAQNIQRPQLTFKDKIDNSLKPWEPKIKYKPNSLKPLAIYLEETEDGEVFCHPYDFELNKFQVPENQLQKREPVKYKELHETPLIMINKPEDIKMLLDDLKNYQEIAVDLEHHSYRSFQGITCLMQISTVDTDYIIDTLVLRSELHELNEIFTKPTILKVFHGADYDIQWLQRDLSLYVVNMFDTHQAAKQLNLPYLGLAHLLERFCKVDSNKHFQLADWRIRPLPDELLKYARKDTHYLLHIKDVLRNALIDSSNGKTNILKAVFDRSTELCKQTYIKPIWTEESYMDMYRRSKKIFNNKQLYALKELHKWRDITAREEDDSTAYVLPNHMLLNIAEALPREVQGISACCNPVPTLLKQNVYKLHKIILKARDQPLIRPVKETDIRPRFVQRNHALNSDAWTYSPHDIPSNAEARADLPCLLDNCKITEKLCNNNKNNFKETKTDLPCLLDNCRITRNIYKNNTNNTNHIIRVFDSSESSEDEQSISDKTSQNRNKKFIFISPYERYKRVIPMVAEQEEKDRQKQEKEEEERLNEIRNKDESLISVSDEQTSSNRSPKPKKKKMCIPLKEMPGRKRKKDLSMNDTSEELSNSNMFTPIPSLNKKIKQDVRRTKDTTNERNKQITVETAPSNDIIKPLRQRKKGEKKMNEKELRQKGMLPAEKFDYKSVDFNNVFQGGSTTNDTRRTNFVQPKQRKKKNKKGKFSVFLKCLNFMMLLYIVLTIILNNVLIVNSKNLYNKTVNLSNEKLSNYTYTWVNKTHDDLVDYAFRSDQVDCLGLGITLANTLSWFFSDKANGTNALDVRFLLSSRNQPNRVQVYIGKQFGLEWTDFKIERKTIIIVHGFLSHSEEEWITEMEKALLQWNDVNVVVVDWSAGGNTWNYYKAAVNTKVVGYQISKFLEHIINATTVTSNWGTIHLIGHSLGAHICGFAAKEFQKRQSNWIIHRITGLDPAQPCFRNTCPSLHLDKTDAPFVDVIHTNGKLLSNLGLGLPEPIGHVDFYPNGGKNQPGCLESNKTYFDYLPIPQRYIHQTICNHGRSYIYLIESLLLTSTKNCKFWSHYWDLTYKNIEKIISEPCNRDVCIEMGIEAENYPHRGTFFLFTNNSSPYCVNETELPEEVKNQLKIDFNDELND